MEYDVCLFVIQRSLEYDLFISLYICLIKTYPVMLGTGAAMCCVNVKGSTCTCI